MSKAVTKDGSITNFTENVVPFGGLVTCPVHALAGNSKHFYRALIKGIGYPVIEFTSAVTLGQQNINKVIDKKMFPMLHPYNYQSIAMDDFDNY